MQPNLDQYLLKKPRNISNHLFVENYLHIRPTENIEPVLKTSRIDAMSDDTREAFERRSDADIRATIHPQVKVLGDCAFHGVAKRDDDSGLRDGLPNPLWCALPKEICWSDLNKNGVGRVRNKLLKVPRGPSVEVHRYDVGIIEIDPSIKLPTMLAFASQDALEKLAPGTPVASIGFPVEGLAGSETATKAPATLHFGYISALTDVFMVRADPAHRLLIQHSVPVTGGASGSPLIDPSGKVIGIVNGGNTAVFKDKSEAMNAKVRLPSAALINFAQRADLLQHLADNNADEELAEDETYWQTRGKEFADYFDVAVADFEALAKKRYAVGKGNTSVLGSGTLHAGDADSFKLVSKTYAFKAEPGKIYGFIADAESGVPIGINVKDKATSAFLRDAKDRRQTSELELAPTAWVTVKEPTTLEVIVWSLVTQPAKYELHAYEWSEPSPAPSADAGS